MHGVTRTACSWDPVIQIFWRLLDAQDAALHASVTGSDRRHVIGEEVTMPVGFMQVPGDHLQIHVSVGRAIIRAGIDC